MQLLKSFDRGSGVAWLLSETLVVVLGVLIALAINDYWTSHNERQLERQYLERLTGDLHSDIEYIDRNVSELLETKIAALDRIAPVVRGEEPVPEDVESFLRNVSLGASGGASSTYWITSTTFDDLKATGNLRLIRDATLRQKIARYYEEFDEFFLRSRDRRTRYAQFVWEIMPGELRDEIDLAALEEFGIDNAIARVRSEEFNRLLNQEYNFALFNQRISSRGARELAAQLESYLERL